jgi:superfamily II DNA or RNA helicase
MSSIQKIPTISDYTHAHAGDVVHKILDSYYSGQKDINIIKDDFERRWKAHKLDEGILKYKKDEYWGMILTGVNLNIMLTSTELKIYYPDGIAFLDGVDTINDRILDWKTSTRSEENESEYCLQLRMYAWMFYRKFNRIPKECAIFYLKYSGSRGQLLFNFTMDDILAAEKWYNDILQQMEYYIANPNKLPPFNKDYFFSPYKSMWDSEDNGSLKVIIHTYGNYVQLEGYIPELLQKGIQKKFSYELKEAFWIKKARPMATTTVCFWNSKKQMLPLGMKDGLIVTLQHYCEHKKIGLDIQIVEHREFDNTVVQMPEKFINNITLRDYQKEAVEIFLRKKIGMLELATGSGKTEISIECTRQLQCKTLFITDKKEMLRQTKKRIEDSLGIKVGSIGAGNSDIQEVCIATIQTLNKRTGEFLQYLKNVKFVIFDECHHVSSDSFVKISKYLIGTEYRLGLSGTAFRSDGNDMKINAVTGYILHNINAKTLIDKGFLIKPKITFISKYMEKNVVAEMEDSCKTGLINETENYSTYYDMFIMNNIFRNNKIVETVNNNIGSKILILTKLINHGRLLQELIPGSVHLYGETNKDDREKMFNDFVTGNNNILISTISIFSEGIDVPSMNIVINASANKGDVKTIQVLGRVLRTLEGKSNAQYIDFIDETRFFRLASLSRKRILQKQGHDVDVK